MQLVLKLRRNGTQSFRTYLLDEDMFLPSAPVDRPHEYVLAEVNRLINTAQFARTFVRLPVRDMNGQLGRRFIKFFPREYRICSVEWVV